MGWGCAKPVVSMRMWSNFPDLFFTSELSIFTRSSLTVQQMHPLFSSTTSSPSRVSLSSTSSWSMPTSPNSFSITATRRLWSSVRTRFRRVVLPEPKKPVTMVAGTRGSSCSGVQTWLARTVVTG